jgi:hypothetical protein
MSKFAYEKGHAKVEGHSTLLRDESSNAIVNTDIDGYKAAVRRKKVFQLQRDEINTIKNEMSEIKQLLGEILERTNGKIS